jgi:hypothetical protein
MTADEYNNAIEEILNNCDLSTQQKEKALETLEETAIITEY